MSLEGHGLRSWRENTGCLTLLQTAQGTEGTQAKPTLWLPDSLKTPRSSFKRERDRGSKKDTKRQRDRVRGREGEQENKRERNQTFPGLGQTETPAQPNNV